MCKPTVIVDVVAAAVAILIGEAAAAAVAVMISEAAAVAKKCGGRLFKLPAPASVLIEDQVQRGPRDSKHGMGLLQY